MNVLFITRKHPPVIGGMENHSYNLIRNFSEQAREREDQVDKIVLNKSQIHLLWWFPYALFLSLRKARSADIVHLGDAVLCPIGWLIKLLYKKPIVVTVHGLDVTFHLFLYQWYLKIFGRGFSRYLCVSRYGKAQAEMRGLSPCVVIPCGVDKKKLKVKSEKLKVAAERFFHKYFFPRDGFILLTVGRLVKRKGVTWFIKNVMPLLPPEMIYLVVGDGPERTKIESVIRKNGLEKKVILLGKISEEELKIVYGLAQLFIMPNIKVPGDAEGFGLVALEAALNRLPVIASGIEGICDAIKQQKNGILVEAENASAFQKEIMHFFGNEEHRREFGLKAQKFIQDNYYWSKIVERYRQEFLKTISN